MEWEFIYKGRYYYWKNKRGLYQCTPYGDQPSMPGDGGYKSLTALMQLKNEPHISFIEVRQMLSNS